MPRLIRCLLPGILLLSAPVLAGEAAAPLTPAAQAATAPADGLDLPTALAEALARSPELARLRAAKDEQEWSRQMALAAALPRVDLRAQQVVGARYSYMGVDFGGAAASFPAAFPESSLQASLRWTIFDGLRSWRQQEAAGLDSEAADLDLQRSQDLLTARVRVAYYEALAAKDLADVAQRDVETLEAHLKVAEAGLDNGIGVRLDVLRLEAQLEESRADAMAAVDHQGTARRDLALAMGMSADERPLVGELPVPDPASLDALPKADAAARPDLKAVQRRIHALEAAHQATTANWSPSVSLYASDDLYHDTDRFDPLVLASDGYQNAYQWGVRLDWNLLDGGASLAQRRMAEDRLLQARQRGRELSLSAPNEVENDRAAFSSAARLYEARRRSVEKSEENARLSRLGLNNGTRTHNEVLDAELDLFRARAGLVRAQADAAEALARLEAAQGSRP